LTSNRKVTIIDNCSVTKLWRLIIAIKNDDILDVSLNLFSKNGYDGTSMQDTVRINCEPDILYDGMMFIYEATPLMLLDDCCYIK